MKLEQFTTVDEFKEVISELFDLMFEVGQVAAEEAGEPVDAYKTLLDSIEAETGERPVIDCLECCKHTPLFIDADGNILIPKKDEDN